MAKQQIKTRTVSDNESVSGDRRASEKKESLEHGMSLDCSPSINHNACSHNGIGWCVAVC